MSQFTITLPETPAYDITNMSSCVPLPDVISAIDQFKDTALQLGFGCFIGGMVLGIFISYIWWYRGQKIPE